MSDELNPAVETPADQIVPDNANPLQDDQFVGEPDADPEGEPEGAAEPEIEYAEVEIGGKKYSVPAELKDGFMMQADYTRKTQEIAAAKRGYEERAAEVQKIGQLSQEEMRAQVHIAGLDAEIAKYAQVDWARLSAEDPIAAQEHFQKFMLLKDQKNQAAGYLENAGKERTRLVQQETAKRLEETRQFAEKNIKGWTPELDAQITEFAEKELGFTRDTLIQAYNPAVYRALYLAHVGQQALSKATAAKPIPGGRSQTIRPLATVSSKASGEVTKDPSEMSMSEYAKWAAKRFKG